MTRFPHIEGYELVDVVGSGGFATVYRAVQDGFGREVALKVLRLDGRNDDVRRAFERECELTGRLTGHPHVLTLLASGFVSDSEEPYLVLEYCTGGSLSGRIDATGPLGIAEALDLGVALAGALQSAHRHGIVHRDVKPHNVLYTRAGVSVLADFGVATLRDPHTLALTGSALTPLHAAPEVIRSEPPSAASDLYSLGSTLYTALTGAPPFGGPSDAPYVVMSRAVSDPPPPIERTDVPEALVELLEAVLSKDPADRPTVAEFADDLIRCAPRGTSPATTFVVLDPPADLDPDTTVDPVDASRIVPSPAVLSLQRTRRRRRRSRTVGAVAAAMAVLAAVAITWVVARRGDKPVALAAEASPSTAASPSTTSVTTTTGLNDLSHMVDGIQPDPAPTFPPANAAFTYQERAGQLESVKDLLGLAQVPVLSDRPGGLQTLPAIPVRFTWVSTNPTLTPKCRQMVTDPITLVRTGQITVYVQQPERFALITLTKFEGSLDAYEFFNAMTMYAGVPESECEGFADLGKGLVSANRAIMRHSTSGIELPKAKLRFDDLNTWKGLAALRDSELNQMSDTSGYSIVARKDTTVVQVMANNVTFLTPQMFDDLVVASANLAGV